MTQKVVLYKPAINDKREYVELEKITEELLNELVFTGELANVLDHEEIGNIKTISEYLNELMEEKQFKKSMVIKESGLNSTFAYQIFAGERKASRNKLLQLAFAMKATLKETQRLLKYAGVNELYYKHRRDVIIIYCLIHQISLEETDEILFQYEEETIHEK